jgi:hypothetical protein
VQKPLIGTAFLLLDPVRPRERLLIVLSYTHLVHCMHNLCLQSPNSDSLLSKEAW